MSAVARLFEATSRDQRGIRLQNLEVLNWGTFDGEIFSARLDGRPTLLVGQNGSGKSTLVDALLTLLVRPGTRNFNVASGAKKRERDERSYLLGAYDRGSDDGASATQAKYLRPGGERPSILLATFGNLANGKTFTLAQFLYLAADRAVEKLYCFSDDERTIRGDFQGITSSDGASKALKARGFRVTRKFQEYESWFSRATKIKPKAMDVFNQTVAVKDVERLNDFVREHMLDPPRATERVDELLNHFEQLNQAHESLVRVRKQKDYLDPIVRVAGDYRAHDELVVFEDRRAAVFDSFRSQKTLEVMGPRALALQEEVSRARSDRSALETENEGCREEIRRLKNQIDREGGERLREIPYLVQIEKQRLESKEKNLAEALAALDVLGLSERLRSELEFRTAVDALPAIKSEADADRGTAAADLEQAVIGRGILRRESEDVKAELEGLSGRAENLPQDRVEIRQALCRNLGIDPKRLPFAAELMRVGRDHRDWESSIESALRSFALSLLVPEDLYASVAGYIDRTRLVSKGRGERLVYIRVARQNDAVSPGADDARRLAGKLEYREGHALLPWLRAEVPRRFPHLCCDSIEEFRHASGHAMTQSRHFKGSGHRHEKDDRDFAANPRNYVLGWDNSEKKRSLIAEIARLDGEIRAADDSVAEAESRRTFLDRRLKAIERLQELHSYSEIDVDVHRSSIEALEAERRAIEEGSDALRLLKSRVAASERRSSALAASIHDLSKREGALEQDLRQAELLLENARRSLASSEVRDSLSAMTDAIESLEMEFARPPLTAEDFFERTGRFREALESRRRALREQATPLRERLIRQMAEFRRQCPEAANDLAAQIEYLADFEALHARIVADDLPRHEKRFKDRLNQNVTRDVGFFRSALEEERREIERRVALLNVSLAALDYRPGAHVRLDLRGVRDAEIAEFRDQLRDCIDGSFDETPAANEARFERVKKLVDRLANETERRWREKVTDVRRWFDFVAAVVDRETGAVLSAYEDSGGQSGGEKAKLAFTILVAAIAYQYDLDPAAPTSDRFHFVVVDEMFSKVDDRHAEYALRLFERFGLQLLIVAPLDAKARVTEPFVGHYLHSVKQNDRSALFEMSAKEFDDYVLSAEAIAATSFE